MKLLEAFRSRNPDYEIDITEDVSYQYGYNRKNERTVSGQKWRCYMVVDTHRIAILFSIAELERVKPDSASGRAIYQGMLVHVNRQLSPYGIQLR